MTEQNECVEQMRRACEGIRDDLRAFREGKVMDVATGRFVEDADGIEDIIDLYGYLMDNYGVRYSIWSDLSYIGCIITFATGGPGICLDTEKGELRGVWGSDTFSMPLDKELVEMVDEVMSDEYDTMVICASTTRR